MKDFEFSLDKLYNYKEQILTEEKNKLLLLNGRRDDMRNEMNKLEAYRFNMKAELKKKQLTGINVRETSSYTFLIDNAKHQIHGLQVDIYNIEKDIAAQTKIVVGISQEVSGLEKLESKQREVYNKEVAKETENSISDYLSSVTVTKQERRQA